MKHLQTVEDFISDEYFQRWVLENDQEAEVYWNRWMARYPKTVPVIKEARQIILSLNFKEDRPEEDRFQQVWKRIQAENQTLATQPLQKARGLYPYTKWKIAAVIALLLTVGVTFWSLWQQNSETITYTTDYGQTRQLILPDSSVVLLNANSTVHYLASWNDDVREVWLQGEAFFQVSKKQIKGDSLQRAKFLVHTDQLDVEVVGTTFNVNTHREKTQVVLNHGRVNINFKNRNDLENLVMQPGEMVEYASRDLMITRERVDTVVYTAWVNKKLIFEDRTLEEIAHALEDNFGYEITFADTRIQAERFTASIPTDDVELLFPMLSRAFNLEMQRNQEKIIYSYK